MLTIPQRFGGLVIPRSRGVLIPTLQYITIASTTSSATTHTFTDVAVGAADPSKILIIVGLSYAGTGNTRPITGITVDGNAATQVARNTTGSANSAIFTYPYASATAVDIAITQSGSNTQCQAAVYAAFNLNSATPFDVDALQWGNSSTQNLTINVPENGIIVGAAKSQNGGTWTVGSLTPDYSLQFDSRATFAGSLSMQAAATGRSFSFQASGSNPKSACIASWGN